MEQLSLNFPIKKHIPDWLAEHFYKANAGTYCYKQRFYSNVKPIVLQNADFCGFDLQIIEHKCFSCGGTGVYKRYHYEYGERYLLSKERCNRCDHGIYEIKRIVLARYLLNRMIYHVPLDEQYNGPFFSEIKGIITHEKVDEKEAVKAYFILLWKFNRPLFFEHAISLSKAKFDKNTQWILDIYNAIFRKGRVTDDLPF